jgi:hypothetical protein
MRLHVNISPYNELPETTHLSLTKNKKVKSKRARSMNRSLNKLDKTFQTINFII